ncbi:MAG: hypothetical protein ACREKN_03325 [Longimicrobiaceae bacterium]
MKNRICRIAAGSLLAAVAAAGCGGVDGEGVPAGSTEASPSGRRAPEPVEESYGYELLDGSLTVDTARVPADVDWRGDTAGR